MEYVNEIVGLTYAQAAAARQEYISIVGEGCLFAESDAMRERFSKFIQKKVMIAANDFARTMMVQSFVDGMSYERMKNQGAAYDPGEVPSLDELLEHLRTVLDPGKEHT